MASRADEGAERGMSIGRVIGRAFGVIGDNPLTVFGLAFLFGALPQLVFGLVGGFATLFAGDGLGVAGYVLIGLGGILLYIVLPMLIQGALVRATMAYAGGRRAGLGECLATGVSVALPLLGLSILFGLGTALGFLLLIVPGVMLYIRWSVAAPALVEERHGVFAAFSRSADLTRGARWKIFGLFLVLLVIVWLALAAVGIVTFLLVNPASIAAQGPAGSRSIGLLVVNAVSTTLMSALTATIPTSLYVELRQWKEGPATDRLADVFS